ncbi:MAG TPA: hypothetical protein VFH43_07805, partial [Candidatus Kapabacteria bacterium]|nr:hypothetical protein [Candidatus Kapabacteria bacterium]
FIVFSGIGTGSVNGGVADAKLDLGSTIRCEKLTGQTTFSNDGCEAFDLVSITPNTGSFVLVSPSLPYHLEPGATVPVVFETNAAGIGALQRTVQARIVTAQNVEQLIDLELAAEIVREMPKPVASAMSLGELSDCRPYDTVITISNPGSCDEITVQGELLTTDAAFVGASSVTIAAGSSATLRIRIQPNAATSLSLRLFGDSFDTTLPISYSFVTGGRMLTFSDDGAELRARLCSTAQKSFTISNPSCHPAEVTRVALDHVTGGVGVFNILNAPQTPLTLGPGESLTLQVQYDPVLIETDISTLVIESDVQNFTSQLNGIIVSPEAVSLALNNPQKPEVNAGDLFTLDITVGLDIPTPLTFTDLVMYLEYDHDMFTLESIEPTWGWELVTHDVIPTGSKITVKHASSTFASSDSIARVTFRSVVTKDAVGSIVLADPELNPSDPNFTGCFANALQLRTASQVEIASFCGDDLIRSALANELPVSNIRMHPQPAGASDADLSITLDAARPTHAGFKLVNVLGLSVADLERELARGTNRLSIPLGQIPSGWYTLIVETEAGALSRPVLIQK